HPERGGTRGLHHELARVGRETQRNSSLRTLQHLQPVHDEVQDLLRVLGRRQGVRQLGQTRELALATVDVARPYHRLRRRGCGLAPLLHQPSATPSRARRLPRPWHAGASVRPCLVPFDPSRCGSLRMASRGDLEEPGGVVRPHAQRGARRPRLTYLPPRRGPRFVSILASRAPEREGAGSVSLRPHNPGRPHNPVGRSMNSVGTPNRSDRCAARARTPHVSVACWPPQYKIIPPSIASKDVWSAPSPLTSSFTP